QITSSSPLKPASCTAERSSASLQPTWNARACAPAGARAPIANASQARRDLRRVVDRLERISIPPSGARAAYGPGEGGRVPTPYRYPTGRCRKGVEARNLASARLEAHEVARREAGQDAEHQAVGVLGHQPLVLGAAHGDRAVGALLAVDRDE